MTKKYFEAEFARVKEELQNVPKSWRVFISAQDYAAGIINNLWNLYHMPEKVEDRYKCSIKKNLFQRRPDLKGQMGIVNCISGGHPDWGWSEIYFTVGRQLHSVIASPLGLRGEQLDGLCTIIKFNDSGDAISLHYDRKERFLTEDVKKETQPRKKIIIPQALKPLFVKYTHKLWLYNSCISDSIYDKQVDIRSMYSIDSGGYDNILLDFSGYEVFLETFTKAQKKFVRKLHDGEINKHAFIKTVGNDIFLHYNFI